MDRGFEEQLRHIGRVPTFSFIDPFGYKGVTLNLLQRMLSGFGCDLVLFFNYNRINAAITNDNVEDHVIALFGNERLNDLKMKLAAKSPQQREVIILDTFAQSLKGMGFDYVHPFTFVHPERNRVSHHLIFVSKSYKGYEVMKDITGRESTSHDDGVPSFGFAAPVSEELTPLLFEFARPLKELGQMLLKEFAGQTIRFEDLYRSHNVGRRYIRKNYRDSLLELEQAGNIVVTLKKKRQSRAGKLTLPEHASITFPETP